MSAPEIRGRRVCVTGGAGFIGSHLVEALVPENDVVVLDDCSNGRPERLPDEVTLIEGDIRDARHLDRALSGADVVFHQAGLVGVEQSVREPVRTNCVNVGATVSLLEYARRNDARVVLASSAAVYGDPASTPVAEDDPKRPTSPYGVDKLAADQYARVFADVYDLPTVALRYFNVYGPGQRASAYSAVVSTYLDRVATGEPLVVNGDGRQTRDFVHVSDVVRANLLAATTDRTGRAYNVGSGESITIRGLAELFCDLTDRTPRIRHTDPRPGDVSHSQADLSRAREDLAFRPTVPLRDGINELLADVDSPATDIATE
ncbi:MAG: NAD-dependent epimerase/dehydratase family protein [Haloarculaceae archaeon]